METAPRDAFAAPPGHALMRSPGPPPDSHGGTPAFFDDLARVISRTARAALEERLRKNGQLLSHYRILEKIGDGGMGVVYKACDTRLDRHVALKFLPPHLSNVDEARRRFHQEARAASALDHANVATVFDIDETDDGQLFIAMAFYEGETLKERMERGPLPVQDAIDLARQVALGLSEAHAGGIVHRDVKPANLIVTGDGAVKLIDFGVAKMADVNLTRAGTRMGTAAYMSPEQARGETVDERADIWALGVVLYEMLAGRRPFRGEQEEAVIYSLLNEDPDALSGLRPDVPPRLDHLVARCLEKDPSLRYRTAAELLEDLQCVMHAADTGTLARERSQASGAPSGSGSQPLPASRVEQGPGAAADEAKHLAVLPFTNVGNAPDNAPFCAGLLETLTTRLTRLKRLRQTVWVIPACEIRKRGIASACEARAAFGATLAVTGSVQHVDDQRRVTLNLIDTKTLRQLRSSLIDAPADQPSVLQDEAVLEVERMLQAELPPRPGSASAADGDGYLSDRRALRHFEPLQRAI